MNPAPVLCFSHLRWNGAAERASHLMRRFAQRHRVFFIEEPVIDATYTEVTRISRNLWRVVPHLGEGDGEQELLSSWRGQLALLRAEHRIDRPILWYYTPSALPVSRDIPCCLSVYDCTLDLSAHVGLAPELHAWERELMRQADVMFVSGRALHAAKRGLHRNLQLVPDSIDAELFGRARSNGMVPRDQLHLTGPLIGYYGSIDDRLDLSLLTELSDLRPGWQFVLIGRVAENLKPVLPIRDNLHYLGERPLQQLPAYLSDWDAVMLPFASGGPVHASAARRVLEALAAAKPVVAAPSPDIEPYARLGFVRVAEDAAGFTAGVAAELRGERLADPAERDAFLAQTSWDGTFRHMYDLVLEALAERGELRASPAAPAPGVQPAPH